MTHFFIPKPSVTVAMQWTGDNFTEIAAWAEDNAPWSLPLVVVDDDRLSTSQAPYTPPLQVSDWLANAGVLPDSYIAQMQEVTAAEVTFDTTPITP